MPILPFRDKNLTMAPENKKTTAKKKKKKKKKKKTKKKKKKKKKKEKPAIKPSTKALLCLIL